jgi:Tfp pilus assembly PilM family ATPase
VRTSSSWLAPPPVSVAIEIASRRVTVAQIGRAGSNWAVTAYASRPLPEAAVVPALSGTNIANGVAVRDALAGALDQAGLRSVRRAALIVPDSIARVSLLTFEQNAARGAELDQLVKWQLRKALPFPIEEAVVSHAPATAAGNTLIAATVARRDVVAEYEAVPGALGIHAGLVDLASFSVMNAIIGSGGAPAGDWLLVHLAAEATSLAILRGADLLFYRHRAAVDEEPLGSLVHQTAMYHEDRLGQGGFARVWVCGAGPAADDARAEVSRRLGVDAIPVDIQPAAALADRIAASADLLESLAAPVGILLRDRPAA